MSPAIEQPQGEIGGGFDAQERRPQPDAGVAATPWTPGPWRVGAEFSSDLSAVESDSGDIGYFTLRTTRERRANARLIAAAPELLEALEELVETLRREAPGTSLNNHRFDALGAKAYAAIAKARGQ